VWVVGGLGTTPSLGSGIGLDKVAHFAIYGLLALLLARAWLAVRWPGTAALPFLLAVLMGGADELRQRSVPGRSAEIADWIADSLGAAVGVAYGLRRARIHSKLTWNDDD
jgi:VanZ family protein